MSKYIETPHIDLKDSLYKLNLSEDFETRCSYDLQKIRPTKRNIYSIEITGGGSGCKYIVDGVIYHDLNHLMRYYALSTKEYIEKELEYHKYFIEELEKLANELGIDLDTEN